MSAVVACFLFGFLGAFLPLLPGALLVWLGILIHKIALGQQSVSWTFFWTATACVGATYGIDALCTIWGARAFGATWRGMVGAMLGLLIGPFLLSPLLGIGIGLGMILGPLFGAVLFEIIGGKDLRGASKAGFGALIGGFFAFFVKIAIIVSIIVAFFMQVGHSTLPGLN
ncbi:MAG: hypothetical protein A2Y14_02765 [Verrucomicrobia bacterium GWF2_51_19]|nr:MAG: hypothetical protein A2Y14_02765 [Verrucomicrobia bacterium GWF2_51_19]